MKLLNILNTIIAALLICGIGTTLAGEDIASPLTQINIRYYNGDHINITSATSDTLNVSISKNPVNTDRYDVSIQSRNKTNMDRLMRDYANHTAKTSGSIGNGSLRFGPFWITYVTWTYNDAPTLQVLTVRNVTGIESSVIKKYREPKGVENYFQTTWVRIKKPNA